MAGNGNEEMFKTTLMGGFDKDDVLRQVQKMKDETYAEKSKLLLVLKGKDKKIAELNAKLEQKNAEIERLEKDIREKYQSYIDNYDMISQLVFDARVRSDRMISDAKAESARILSEAQATAQKCLDSVQHEVDEKLSEGKKKYVAVQEELNDIVELINQVQRRFMQSYKSVHAIVSTMPESLQDLEDEMEEDLVQSQPVEAPEERLEEETDEAGSLEDDYELKDEYGLDEEYSLDDEDSLEDQAQLDESLAEYLHEDED